MAIDPGVATRDGVTTDRFSGLHHPCYCVGEPIDAKATLHGTRQAEGADDVRELPPRARIENNRAGQRGRSAADGARLSGCCCPLYPSLYFLPTWCQVT